MARRRLTPAPAFVADPGFAEARPGADVPRAEQLLAGSGLGSDLRAGPAPIASAPIARVAAEAAGTAALQEIAETLSRARNEGRLVLDLPLGEIAPDHLARDRIAGGMREDPEMVALRESLRAHGQRTPIEVTPLGTGRGGALPYGLISGWRRLQALKALHAETGEPRFATIQALIRRPETAADAYVAMVEENEIRLGLSQYERARVAARATERGIFASEKAALLALFATASRAKRSRIRAFLEIYHALDGALRFPAHLPERLGLLLVERLRAGEGPRIEAALAAADPQEPEAEIAVLTALLAPGARPAPAAHRIHPDRTHSDRAPREAILPGIELETRLERGALTLKFTGSAVSADLAAAVRQLLRGLRETGQGETRQNETARSETGRR